MPEKKKDLKSEKVDTKSLIGLVYRLRILQGKSAEPATIYRYEQQEEEILAKLKKIGLKAEDVEEEIDKILGKS